MPISDYTDYLADEIADEIQNNAKSLERICKENPHFPKPSTIRSWLTKNDHPYFTEAYRRAKANQAYYIVDKMYDLAEDAIPDNFGRVEKAALQIKTLQWIAPKLKPRVFGEKPEIKEKEPDVLTDSEKLDKILATIKTAKLRKNESKKK